jgi:hypothetical protein
MKEIYNIRRVVKSTPTSGVEPYCKSNPTLYTSNIPNNQIYPGELFFNQTDKKLWVGYKDVSGNTGTELINPTPTSGGITLTYQKNQYHCFRKYFGRTTGQNINGYKTYRIRVESDVTINQIGVYVVTAAPAGTEMVIGIYEFDKTSFYPTNLLVQTAPIPLDVTLGKLANITPTFLPAGEYIVNYSFSNGNTGCLMYSLNLAIALDGFQINQFNFNPNDIWGFNTTTFPYNPVLPATFPAGAGLGSSFNNHIPFVIFRVI